MIPPVNKEHNLLFVDGSGNFWFPGRWVGGVCMIIAPILLLTGVLLRIKFHFFFPQQLEAYHKHPGLMTSAYNCILFGNIMLCPAIITLGRMIGKKKPQLAIWGCMFVLLGLFARTFSSGIDHLAFQLVHCNGLDSATKSVADSYGNFKLIAALNGTIMFGWIILATGTYASGTLTLASSLSLATMSALMIGVLKGSNWVSVLATAGLCVAIVATGFRVLQEGPAIKLSSTFYSIASVIIAIILLYFFGQLG